MAPFFLSLLAGRARHERLRELSRVAGTLGASPWQVWRRVTLPVLLRAATPTLSVYFLVLTSAFEVPLLVGASYPQMISVLVQRRFAQFDLVTKPQAYATASRYGVVATAFLVGNVA